METKTRIKSITIYIDNITRYVTETKPRLGPPSRLVRLRGRGVQAAGEHSGRRRGAKVRGMRRRGEECLQGQRVPAAARLACCQGSAQVFYPAPEHTVQ